MSFLSLRHHACLCAFLLLAGCGGGGEGESILTRASEARFDRDATILASREVVGYVVPIPLTQSLHNELAQVRGEYPETASVHARAFYDPHELHFALAPSAPWLAAWKAGELATGIPELDAQFRTFNAQSVHLLSDEGDQLWFAVRFDTYLRANRAAGLFIGKSAAFRIVSVVEPPGKQGDTDIQYEQTTDTPPVLRLIFRQGESETVYEKTGRTGWTQKLPL